MSTEAKRCDRHGTFAGEECPQCQYRRLLTDAAACEQRRRFAELRRSRLESFDHTPGLWVIVGRIAFGQPGRGAR